MASHRRQLLEMSDSSILEISSLSLRDDDADNGGAAAFRASMRPTMTSECHNSYRESAELMQVCGASTTPRRSNRLRSTASRPAHPASTETILQGIRTDLNLPLQNRNQNQNSNGRMNLTGPDMHLVMGPPSVMECGYIPTIQNYPQIDVNDLFGKKDIEKNNKDAEANNKTKINKVDRDLFAMLGDTKNDLLQATNALGEALSRERGLEQNISELEQNISKKDREIQDLKDGRDISELERNISEKTREIQHLKDFRKCKVCMENEVDQVFSPCGHVICCQICITKLRTCPICRAPIKDTLLAFFS